MMPETEFTKFPGLSIDQGPVVQSIVSLTSSLRGQLIKCFMTLLPKILIFFDKKYWQISDINA